MKEIWNKWMRDVLFIYCGLYTAATIINSIIYLSQGIYEDPAGNWHELDRAMIVLIVTAAYGLIRYLKIRSFILKSVIVYVPTMLLTFLYVYLRGLNAELASGAYRDIFINYTAGFLAVAVIVFVIRMLKRHGGTKNSDGDGPVMKE